MVFVKGSTSNENNPNWNPEAGRGPILEWVKRRIGRPKKCSECNTNKSGRFVWYSRSGEYKRDTSDYIRLCNSCFTKKRKLIAWNKGLTKELDNRVASSLKGIKKPEYTGINNPNYRGNNVHYNTLQDWAIKEFGREDICENCNNIKAKKYNWLNIDKRKKRRRDGWIRVCTSCLFKYHKAFEERDQSGKKNPNWNGGVSTEYMLERAGKQAVLWREAIFKRDNYSCLQCGETGRVEADHIKPWKLYPELRYALDNGQTLCRKHHRLKTNDDLREIFKINKQNKLTPLPKSSII